jgi:hypothetical protein
LARNLSGLLPQASSSFATKQPHLYPQLTIQHRDPSKYNAEKTVHETAADCRRQCQFCVLPRCRIEAPKLCVDVAGDAYEAINRLKKINMTL